MSYGTEDFIKPKIKYSREVSLEEVVAEAVQIKKRVRELLQKYGNTLSVQNEICNIIEKEHPEYSKMYSFITRVVCIYGMFNKEIFKTWLLDIARNPAKSDEDFIKQLVKYYTRVWRKYNPRSDHTQEKKIMLEALLEENRHMKKTVEDLEKKVSTKDSELKSKDAEFLRDFLQVARPTLGKAGKCFVECVVPEGTPAILGGCEVESCQDAPRF